MKKSEIGKNFNPFCRGQNTTLLHFSLFTIPSTQSPSLLPKAKSSPLCTRGPFDAANLDFAKSPLCKGRWVAVRRAGGIVASEKISQPRNNPPVFCQRQNPAPFAQGGLLMQQIQLQLSFPLHKGAIGEGYNIMVFLGFFFFLWYCKDDNPILL